MDFAENGSGKSLGFPVPQGVYGLWDALTLKNTCIGFNKEQEEVLKLKKLGR